MKPETLHPSVFIIGEMEARAWNRDRLASAMCEKMSDKKVNTGDWVAFMDNGQIVIGKVEYIVSHRVATWEKELFTTAGVCSIDAVLEIRGAQALPEERR